MSLFEEEALEEGLGMFFKLDDGESANVVFRAPPLTYYNVYDPATKKSSEYPYDGVKPEGASKRHKLNVLQWDDKDQMWVAQILQASNTLANDIQDKVEKRGLDYLFEIKRSGTGKKTTYTVDSEGELSPLQKEKLNDVKLFNLELKKNDED